MYQRKPPTKNSARNTAEVTPAVIRTLLSRGIMAEEEETEVSELIDIDAGSVASEVSFADKPEVTVLAVVFANAVFEYEVTVLAVVLANAVFASEETVV